jgi:hypothetical protein
MAFEINWNVGPSDKVLQSPLYQKWSVQPASSIAGNLTELKQDLGSVIMNRESAGVASYLAWLLRTVTLIGG